MKQRTQVKNRIHAILHQNLIAPDVSDLFGKAGRRFLQCVRLPVADRRLLEADLRTLDNRLTTKPQESWVNDSTKTSSTRDLETMDRQWSIRRMNPHLNPESAQMKT